MTIIENIFSRKKKLSIEEFVNRTLYKKKIGYYQNKNPFGKDGDFITSPSISPLFSEMIGIWIINFWESLNKPTNFNFVELGPGNGQMCRVINDLFQKFPEFYKSINIFLYEKSTTLKKIQKRKINSSKIKWISNFNNLKKGPVIFFGNEFFDAIPIKQYVKKNNIFYEKFVEIQKKNTLGTILKKASKKDTEEILKFKVLKNLNFIEYPKMGFQILNKIIKVVERKKGGILLIDYGYIKQQKKSTLQSIKNHKKQNFFENIGQSDITSLVNFKLLKEYLHKKDLDVSNIVTQSFFLKRVGILNRAEILSNKMSFRQKADLYIRLKRLLHPKIMGNLFKVILASKNGKKKLGFN
ncbi:MAG: SAM-dependent methyltransferase [Pelagibacteraceae bacterium]